MRHVAQVIFILSVIGLTLSYVMPGTADGCSWEESFPWILLFSLMVIVSWVFSSGLRRKDDTSGKKFGWPRIRWGWLGLWCIIVGGIVSAGSTMKAEDAKWWLEYRYRTSDYGSTSYTSEWLYRDSLEDARVGQVLGGVISVVGVVSGIITGALVLRRRRRVRLEI